MIEKLSQKTAIIISKSPNALYDIDVYKYAFFIIYSTILFSIISLLIGLIVGNVVQSLLFFCSFYTLRIFAGGYHCSKESYCEIITTILLLFSIVLIRITEQHNKYIIVLITTIIGALIILATAPIDCIEKHITEKEKTTYKAVTIIVITIISCVIILSLLLKKLNISTPLSFSIIVESILLIFGRIQQMHHTKYAK